MYQKIDCANCGANIFKMFGDAWAQEGWAECKKCGYETQISNAQATGVCKRLESPSDSGNEMRSL